jgi:hypothetical protein
MRGSVRTTVRRTLRVLVKPFDWLDGIESQPITEILALYVKAQDIKARITNTLSQRPTDAEEVRVW